MKDLMMIWKGIGLRLDQEKDLGMIIRSNLKADDQCLEARNRANKMLGVINSNVVYKSNKVISKLHNSNLGQQSILHKLGLHI